MQIPFFDLKRTLELFRDELHDALDLTIANGMFIGGNSVSDFEKQYADYIGVSECVLVGNGLDALKMSLEALGIGPGDEVIVPGFTFIATWIAVLQVGATPVPIDVELNTANIDPAKIEYAITEKTKAIIPVHLFGTPAEVMQIKRIADAHNLYVIDDAAQCHGAEVEGSKIGTTSSASAFSFYPTKNLGALGDSGCITTSDLELAINLRSLRSYGQGSSKYDHVRLGYNSRTDTLQASFLSIFLRNLDTFNSKRKYIASVYREALGSKAIHSIGPKEAEQSVWHHFVLRCHRREDFIQYMKSQGIATDMHYPYAPHQISAVVERVPSLAKLDKELTHSKELAKTVVSLPIGPWMNANEIEYVANVLSKAPEALFAK